MGHAGAIVGGSDDTAEAKKTNHERMWNNVVDSPAEIGKKVKEVIG
jgi:succinyl-CoA synthetase alpha subunit